MNAFLGTGQCVGPLLSNFLTVTYSYRTSQDIFAVGLIIFALLYFSVAGGLQAFRCSNKNQHT